MILRTSRDIKAGDELCISYISNLLSPTASRQRDLRSYGFQCTCGRCSNASISDARSEEFREINKPKAMMIEGEAIGAGRANFDYRVWKYAVEDVAGFRVDLEG
ncbi:hypothetical protein MPER_10478 [Moniliophthora perniciosa FA553]|nr:hypothetical protein MPER_10478 [Moniliophthora perniciosa FA553]